MSMECECMYGMTVTWQYWSTWKETYSSATLSTTKPTWTGPQGVKFDLEGENDLCTIILCVNTEFFLHPLQVWNVCPSLFYQTTLQFQDTHVVCRSPRRIYMSFPNGSTLSLTNT